MMSGLAGKSPWREAASVILAVRGPQTASSAKSFNPVSSSTPPWQNYFNYQVLMLKRSSKSSFMPSACVFPGGVLSQPDFSQKWLDWFSCNSVRKEDLEKLVIENVARPLLMKKQSSDELISRDLAFRLTAIRETFEESGILLIKPEKRENNCSRAFTFSSTKDLSLWRKKVHDEPSELLELYRWIGELPDVWGLAEWADWLTPTDLHEQGTRRFDTIFYLVNLAACPETILDQAEVAGIKWADPGTLLHSFYERQHWLAPPQVYELSRMLNFRAEAELGEFARQRAGKGCRSWLPVRLQCSDGLISILPGDSRYPAEPDFFGDSLKKEITSFPGTMAESEQGCEYLNRLVFKNKYDCRVRISHVPPLGHVAPLDYHRLKVKCYPDFSDPKNRDF